MASCVLKIDGISLRHWKNKRGVGNPPRGYVWINHGLGEHSARYEVLGDFLAGFGWDVLAPDLPGHGLTLVEGVYSKLLSPAETLPVLNELILEVAKRTELGEGSYFLKAPKFLIGHSMGAMISAHWICSEALPYESFEWSRAFLSAPPFELRLRVPSWKLNLAKWLKVLAPDVKISNEISASDLSIDVSNISEYRSDDLVHGHASPRLFWGIRESSEYVISHANMIEIPVCVAVAKNDPIVSSDSVRAFFDLLNTHKKYLEFPISKHEIFNDVEKKLVYESLLKWFAA